MYVINNGEGIPDTAARQFASQMMAYFMQSMGAVPVAGGADSTTPSPSLPVPSTLAMETPVHGYSCAGYFNTDHV